MAKENRYDIGCYKFIFKPLAMPAVFLFVSESCFSVFSRCRYSVLVSSNLQLSLCWTSAVALSSDMQLYPSLSHCRFLLTGNFLSSRDYTSINRSVQPLPGYIAYLNSVYCPFSMITEQSEGYEREEACQSSFDEVLSAAWQ